MKQLDNNDGKRVWFRDPGQALLALSAIIAALVVGGGTASLLVEFSGSDSGPSTVTETSTITETAKEAETSPPSPAAAFGPCRSSADPVTPVIGSSDPYERNESASQAALISPRNSSGRAVVSDPTDVDYFVFCTKGPADLEVSMTLTGCPDLAEGTDCANLFAEVQDADGSLLPGGDFDLYTLNESEAATVSSVSAERFLLVINGSRVSDPNNYEFSINPSSALSSRLPK